VRVRSRLAFLLAAALGAAAAVLPALAGSETTPTVEAINVGSGLYSEHHCQPAQSTIAPGGTVTFANASEVPHGVEWIGTVKPSCEEGPGKVPVGNSPAASATKWSGACTFAQAGTYLFYCTVHGAAMSGTVTVQAPATTTSGSPALAGEGHSTLTTTAGPPPSAVPALARLTLAPRVRGGSVQGSVLLSAAGARVEVELSASRASLGAKPRGSRRVVVGRLTRSSLGAGSTSFTVPLTRRARRVLRRHGHLALRVTVVLSRVGAAPTTLTRALVLHA